MDQISNSNRGKEIGNQQTENRGKGNRTNNIHKMPIKKIFFFLQITGFPPKIRRRGKAEKTSSKSWRQGPITSEEWDTARGREEKRTYDRAR